MVTPNILVAIASFGCFASFSWGVRAVFAAPLGMPAEMKWLGALALIFFAWQCYAILHADISWLQFGIGMLIYMASLFLFWWSVPCARRVSLHVAFTDLKPTKLLRSGPYRFIRHPFYTSYLLFWINAAVIVWQLWLTIPAGVMAMFYFTAMRREENAFLSGPLAEEYSSYKACTGMLVPRFL